jgi:predicted DNA-binding antitoxin AbrB/MazE fold protein
MYAVKAIYDRNIFKLEEPIPIKEKYEVVITFTKPLKKTQEKILDYFNTWDEEDVNCIEEIVKERENFSRGRDEI